MQLCTTTTAKLFYGIRHVVFHATSVICVYKLNGNSLLLCKWSFISNLEFEEIKYLIQKKASITTVGGQTFYQKGCASTCTAGQLISYFNGAPFNGKTSCCTGSNCNSHLLFNWFFKRTKNSNFVFF